MRNKNNQRFLEMPNQAHNYTKARYVVIPCPHEQTTSYGKGTKHGPAAILRASQEIEWYDLELGYETFVRKPVFTDKAQTINNLEARVASHLSQQKIPVVLGGEHSITPSVVRAIKAKYPELSVLQLDAHADLRDTYEGRQDSHACVMRRVLEICPAVQAGIRSMSKAEFDWAKESRQLEKINFFPDADKINQQLSEAVYITIDVDILDPAVMPATGTPEPGGLTWFGLLELLQAVCAQKKVVGFDLVEFSPRPHDQAADFTAAKLIYKLMGLMAA